MHPYNSHNHTVHLDLYAPFYRGDAIARLIEQAGSTETIRRGAEVKVKANLSGDWVQRSGDWIFVAGNLGLLATEDWIDDHPSERRELQDRHVEDMAFLPDIEAACLLGGFNEALQILTEECDMSDRIARHRLRQWVRQGVRHLAHEADCYAAGREAQREL